MSRLKKSYILILFLGIIFLSLVSGIKTHPGSPNDLSRLAGIIAIARFNELNIDRTTQITTIDKAEVNGKFYSSKPPVLNWLSGQAVKWGFTTVKPALIQNDVAIYKTATFLSATLPLFLTISLFLFMFMDIFKNPLISIAATAPLLFSTLNLPYAQYLNNHTPTAFFTLVIFISLFIFKLKPIITEAIIGISLSAILALDPPFALLITLALLPFLLKFLRYNYIKSFLRIFVFSLPISLLHFHLTYKIFGILTIPQFYTERFFAYEGSHWLDKPPDDLNVYNPGFFMVTLNHLFLSHGFFLYMPIFFLFFFYKNRREAGWLFSLLLLIISVAAFSLFSTNYGGWSYGARRLIPLIPLFYFYTIKTIYTLDRKLILTVVVPLFLLSTIFAFLGFENTWNNKRLQINRKIAYFPLLYNLNRKYLHFYEYDP